MEQVVRALEDKIRSNPTESAHAFDQNGTLVLSRSGGQYEVSFTSADIAHLRDTVLTHNHPRGLSYPTGDPRAQGNSFSLSDLELATRAQVAEIRAVTPVWRHSMRRPSTGWNAQYFHTVLEPAFSRHDQAVQAEFLEAIRTGSLTPAEATARHYHEVWLRVANELGLQYRREA
ncbi:MAG: hypothetical protein HY690_10865 [Chloroflexi bacterium]|nr:hypothetical protein [Chloroflexota bacterium]